MIKKALVIGGVVGCCLAMATFVRARVLTVGPSQAAYATIAAGVSVAQPGDTVLVLAGSYEEKIISVRAGQADARIVLKASPRRTAIVRGASITHNDITLEGFEMTGQGIEVNASHVDVVDNYIHDAGQAFGLSGGTYANYTSHHVRFIRNRVYHSQYGFVLSGVSVLVENNEVERIFQYDTTGDADYSRLFGDSITVRGNYFHGTIHSEVPTAHNDIIQFFSNNGEYLRNLVVENNVFMDADQGFMTSNTTSTNSGWFIVRNNVYAHLWAWGNLFWDIGNVQVYNNVYADMKWWGCEFSGNSHNNLVKNNIFYNGQGLAYLTEHGATMTGDYNLVYNAKPPISPGAHDKIGVDPLFVDPARNDFHLTGNSPCIDAGADMGLTYDNAGHVRPQGAACDIGPYEAGTRK